MSGCELDFSPSRFIVSAENPFADPFEYRVTRLAKKVAAGAQFIQTQCVFDIIRFQEWLKMAREAGLTEKVHILAGVTPLKSARMAQYMATKVSGISIPEETIRRMESAPKGKAAAEGVKICLETIQQLREIKGLRGVHIMAIEWEEKVPELVKAAGLYPRPQLA